MYRAVLMSNKWYAIEVGEINDLANNDEEMENISIFVGDGDIVVLVDDIENMKSVLNLDDDEIEVVER